MVPDTESTIAAVATPPGKGGVGIVRVSGKDLTGFLASVHPGPVAPRKALLTDFNDEVGNLIDRGLLLYFPAPHSFTGEDVIELQGHGGPMVMDNLLQWTLRLGARPARPGEFSLRAFLNDKIDLAQAEAIADLIDATTHQAARSAMRSLEGEFSRSIHHLVENLIQLRIYVEAAIDFPDEEVDFLSEGGVLKRQEALIGEVTGILSRARQGALLRDGMTVVIAGKPNAGKSSLLNALSGRDTAIVTDIAGTTRDVLRESINIDGMPLHVVDTAGLRDSGDAVEREGIRRAWQEIERADRVLLVADVTIDGNRDPAELWPEYAARFPGQGNLTIVYNKIDCLDTVPENRRGDIPSVALSAKTGEGMEQLKDHLKQCMGYEFSEEGNFMARRRHLDILTRVRDRLATGRDQLADHNAGELLAEDLRIVQQLLGEITGEFSSDDLLGRIFSSFCIGK